MKKTIALLGFTALLMGLSALAQDAPSQNSYQYVKIPTNNSIQKSLINKIPVGIFTTHNVYKTPFSIPSKPDKCGYDGKGPCNFYDKFGLNGSGKSITIKVSIPKVTHVYTLMNAYYPANDQQLATIEFFGSAGATETVPLVGGKDIRDFYQGNFANGLTNGIPHVKAVNAFKCVDPKNCLGAGGTGNVNTGLPGIYVVDEQNFSLSSEFATQNLIKIKITDTYNGSVPILLGITVQ